MARTLSSTVKTRKLRKTILRSIYYGQRLPQNIVDSEAREISVELNSLVLGGFVKRADDKLELTESGRNLIYKLNGGHRPPMIDLPMEEMLPKAEQREFIVGGSLAEAIFREVSLGE